MPRLAHKTFLCRCRLPRHDQRAEVTPWTTKSCASLITVRRPLIGEVSSLWPLTLLLYSTEKCLSCKPRHFFPTLSALSDVWCVTVASLQHNRSCESFPLTIQLLQLVMGARIMSILFSAEVGSTFVWCIQKGSLDGDRHTLHFVRYFCSHETEKAFLILRTHIFAIDFSPRKMGCEGVSVACGEVEPSCMSRVGGAPPYLMRYRHLHLLVQSLSPGSFVTWFLRGTRSRGRISKDYHNLLSCAQQDGPGKAII